MCGDILGSLIIAPCSAGSMAPLGGLFLLLKSSQISSIFTHLTPGLQLMYSINLVESIEMTRSSVQGGAEMCKS